MFERSRFFGAIQREDLEAVKALLKKDSGLARLQSSEYHGGPIGKAARCKDMRILEAILDAGADVHSDEARSVLDTGANTNDRKVAEQLLKHGADVNYLSWNGTPLHRAADWCHLEMVQFLLENGAVVNAIDREGRTPLDKTLECRSKHGTPEKQMTIDLLTQHGAVAAKSPSSTPAAPGSPAAAAARPETSCRHAFAWITSDGLRCDVCHQVVSAELVSEGRGKHCKSCGYTIHVNCQ